MQPQRTHHGLHDDRGGGPDVEARVEHALGDALSHDVAHQIDAEGTGRGRSRGAGSRPGAGCRESSPG